MSTARYKTNTLRDRLLHRGINIPFDDVNTLRRAELTLHRWAELECGDGNDYASWSIERDEESEAHCTQCGHGWYGETAEHSNCPQCGDIAPVRRKATGKPYFCRYPHQGKPSRSPVADREAGALKRVAKLCKDHGLSYFHQTDPRGAALYVSREPINDTNYRRLLRGRLGYVRQTFTKS